MLSDHYLLDCRATNFNAFNRCKMALTEKSNTLSYHLTWPDLNFNPEPKFDSSTSSYGLCFHVSRAQIIFADNLSGKYFNPTSYGVFVV